MHTHISRSVALTVLLLVAPPLILFAQGAPPSPAIQVATSGLQHAIPVPSAHAVRRSAPVVIDGRLDERAWKDATPVTDFTQVDPDMGKPASQRTEMRFLFDDDALYIGARMFDTEGAKGVRTSLVRRDEDFHSDFIQIIIDGFHDHLGQAIFALNPSGSKNDVLGVGSSCCDPGWDPIWEGVAHVDAEGWTAEIRIPLSQLRFSGDSVQTWGLQLRRFIQRTNESDQWSYWSKTESGGPSRFGHLEGILINPKAATRHLELLPYAVASARNVAFVPGDPFNTGSVRKAKAGLDLKYLLSSNLTLDATFNPDFGQVEADPAVINLSAFETSFTEKRPFFVANSGVFDFSSFNCFFCSNVSSLNPFYSRRIGRSPTGADLAFSRGAYADVPDAATILGAGKITGRTRTGFTLGLIEAVTGRESARVQLDNGTRTAQEVEPLTNYFVGRLKKDFMGGNLVVGGIATWVVRNMDSTFAPRLNAHAELVGNDFQYTWREHVFSLRGQYARSRISGDSRAILARQRGSARYFQRPDRGAGSGGFFSNRLDSAATSMTGGGAYLRLAKDAGDWLWETAVDLRTPGFENNDLGFLRRADFVWYNANVIRSWTKPTSWYRDFALLAGGQQQRNFEGDLTDRQLQIYLGGTAKNFWTGHALYLWRPPVLDDRLLRGGPVVEVPQTSFASVDLSSDSRHAVIWGVNAGYASNSNGGWGNNLGASVQYRPITSVRVSVGPSWSASRSLLQYVTAVTDPALVSFYGSRYVLASLSQKALSFDTRLSLTFTPAMSLELFAQPLIASGQYYDFKEFDAPRSGTYSVYGRDRGSITSTRSAATGLVSSYAVSPGGTSAAKPFTFSNPDFNFRSLRGNAVFRWEYHPGATLYMAWTHARADTQGFGDFDLNRDRAGLLATRPDNIFLLKASWWLAR